MALTYGNGANQTTLPVRHDRESPSFCSRPKSWLRWLQLTADSEGWLAVAYGNRLDRINRGHQRPELQILRKFFVLPQQVYEPIVALQLL
jgi:hypothetical protein